MSEWIKTGSSFTLWQRMVNDVCRLHTLRLIYWVSVFDLHDYRLPFATIHRVHFIQFELIELLIHMSQVDIRDQLQLGTKKQLEQSYIQ